MAEDRREDALRIGAGKVNASVWQTPVALISTSTSPAFGPSSCTVSIVRAPHFMNRCTNIMDSSSTASIC